jgi:hypothetical protein
VNAEASSEAIAECVVNAEDSFNVFKASMDASV